MKRCTHAGRVSLYEIVECEAAFDFEGGVLTHDYSGDGRPTGRIVAESKDCGRVARGSAESLPLWARRLWDGLRAQLDRR